MFYLVCCICTKNKLLKLSICCLLNVVFLQKPHQSSHLIIGKIMSNKYCQTSSKENCFQKSVLYKLTVSLGVLHQRTGSSFPAVIIVGLPTRQAHIHILCRSPTLMHHFSNFTLHPLFPPSVLLLLPGKHLDPRDRCGCARVPPLLLC